MNIRKPILTRSQAEAVYLAMGEMKKSGEAVKIKFGDEANKCLKIYENSFGETQIVSIEASQIVDAEHHQSLDEFAMVYGLKRPGSMFG